MVVKSKTPAKSKAPATPEKRTYVRRADIEERLVDTALRLLLTRDPESLTIREIAAQAKTHHRYIPDYFGGKGPLLLKSFRVRAHPLLASLRKELSKLFRVLNWSA